MGITNFQITFDNPTRTFSAGSSVSGLILVAFDKPKTTNGIIVTLHGEAKVHWTEKRSTTDSNGNRRTHTDHYRADETYVHSEICVYTPTNASREIPSGRHEFPFNFVLPPTLPTSFESQYSNVRYFVKAKVHRPWRFDHKVKEFFTVNAVLDLNGNFNYGLGVSVEDYKTGGCCCCTTGPVHCQVKLPKSGYVAGERISPVVVVDNTRSTDDVPYVKIKLQQQIINKTRRKNKTQERDLTECHIGNVSAGKKREFTTAHLSIPAVPPTNLGGYCHIIEVHYYFKVTVEMGGWSSNIRIPTYLTIGTVPIIRQVVAPPSAPPPQPTAPLPDVPPPYPGPSAPLLSDHDLPPPSYEECMFGRQNVGDEDDNYVAGNKMFAPRYPMYGFRT